MKTIGLLGGMSWQSTVGYYRAINTGVEQALGGLHSAQVVLYSVDFAPLEARMRAGDWQGAAGILQDAARRVASGGADCLLICTNTMHKLAPEIAAAVDIPLIHIADATAEVLIRDGVERVGLLGTAFTMEEEFYRGRLGERFGLDVMVPDEADRNRVHDIIFNELCRGVIRPESRKMYLRIVADLGAAGAQAVILGCTEIGLLIRQADTPVPLYDTTAIHAAAAVAWALTDGEG